MPRCFRGIGRIAFELSTSIGDALGKPLEKGDIEGAIAAASKDKYLIAPGNDAARKRMAMILSANPQDLTHPELELPVKPALPRLERFTSQPCCSLATPTFQMFMHMQEPSRQVYLGPAAW
jgi:hypothetical protein